MIELKLITNENRREMFNLQVSRAQRKYVASNLSSVASSYVLSTNGSQVFPRIIYNDNKMIGFVMIVYGNTGYDQPEYALENYCLLRLMIDEKYQGRGYGRQAMAKIIDFVKSCPAGPAECCWIPFSQSNENAKKLYESFGFVDTGQVFNGENISILKLD